MASITTWMRLEPHARAADMEASLEMRVHDPLWLLARQWQFGEIQGEDTGSPVQAAYAGTAMPIALYLPGPIAGHGRDDVQEYTPNMPLEFLVERERTPADEVLAGNRRLAVEAGQHFLRLLGAPLATKYRAQLLTAYGVQPVPGDKRTAMDSDSLALLDLMARRTLDGARLLAIIQESAPGMGATRLGFDGEDTQAAARAITAWLQWCEQLVGPVGPDSPARAAWNPERMEYACALAAPLEAAGDQVVLAAAEYPGGHLDWYSFDVSTVQRLERDSPVASHAFGSTTLPTALSFRGMPANRLWEFEDAQVSFGAVGAAPTDLARMLLVEFLIEYGNDFFTIPIALDKGALYRIAQLTITNTFGDATSVKPFAEENWRMFALATDSAAPRPAVAPGLFLPPALDQHLASPPIEDVHLLREEMANMAWAVEHLVESACGQPLNRHEAYQAHRQRTEDQQPPAGAGRLVYHLDTWQTTLPDYWLPLLLQRPPSGESPMRLECHESPSHSRGRLLAEHGPEVLLAVFDEEVPRMGAHVTRAHQYTRWYNSGLFAWIGREKRPGRGEGASGLHYDVTAAVQAP